MQQYAKNIQGDFWDTHRVALVAQLRVSKEVHQGHGKQQLRAHAFSLSAMQVHVL